MKCLVSEASLRKKVRIPAEERGKLACKRKGCDFSLFSLCRRAFLFLEIALFLPYYESAEVAEIQGNEGVEVTFAEDGVVCGYGDNE